MNLCIERLGRTFTFYLGMQISVKATSKIQTIEPKGNNVVGATILNTLIIKYPDGLIETLKKEEYIRYKKINGERKELGAEPNGQSLISILTS